MPSEIGLSRADAIAYVHFEDVDPPSNCDSHVTNLNRQVDYNSITLCVLRHDRCDGWSTF